MIRVVLPLQLCTLANTSREVNLEVAAPVTIDRLLGGLEERYPMLRGTIRDQVTLQRRPFIRFFVCGEDWSLEPPTNPLPKDIISGKEVFRVVGAMAGG